MVTIGVTVSDIRSMPVELQQLSGSYELIPVYPGELHEKIGTCDILYLWNLAYDELKNFLQTDRKVPSLILVARQGQDDWLVDMVHSAGATIKYATNAFSDVISEYAVAGVFMLSKNLHLVAVQSEWEKHFSLPVANAQTLILGRGSIATKIEKLLQKNNVEVRKIGRSEIKMISDRNVTPKDKQFLFETANVICCLPSGKDTNKLLDLNFFSFFNEVNFINISRSSVLISQDFKQALDDNNVRAALLDVFDTEPLPDDDSLWGDSRVVVSPHHAYRSRDWEQRLHKCFVEYLGTNDKIN